MPLSSRRLIPVLFLALAIGAPDGAQAKRHRRAAAPAKAATPAQAPTSSPDGVADRVPVRDFIKSMVDQHRFDEADLLGLFAQVRTSPDVLRLIAPPRSGFKRSWSVYRARFLDPVRIREGARFWRDNQAAIDRASARYGVPAEIIVSIIGVETVYGRMMGEFRVIDALTTLAFEDPRRADFFRDELAAFLLHCRDNRADPLSVRGSYAGAIGIPQFMPSSIRRFAVDFDEDKRIDLRQSSADAIGSVARFLAEHGWRAGEATHFRVAFDDIQRAQPLIDAGIEPRLTLDKLSAYGVGSPDAVPPEMPLALIDLPNGDDPTVYLLGGPNFYVITRYNRSSFYAMAVIELAQRLKADRP